VLVELCLLLLGEHLADGFHLLFTGHVRLHGFLELSLLLVGEVEVAENPWAAWAGSIAVHATWRAVTVGTHARAVGWRAIGATFTAAFAATFTPLVHLFSHLRDTLIEGHLLVLGEQG